MEPTEPGFFESLCPPPNQAMGGVMDVFCHLLSAFLLPCCLCSGQAAQRAASLRGTRMYAEGPCASLTRRWPCLDEREARASLNLESERAKEEKDVLGTGARWVREIIRRTVMRPGSDRDGRGPAK